MSIKYVYKSVSQDNTSIFNAYFFIGPKIYSVMLVKLKGDKLHVIFPYIK